MVKVYVRSTLTCTSHPLYTHPHPPERPLGKACRQGASPLPRCALLAAHIDRNTGARSGQNLLCSRLPSETCEKLLPPCVASHQRGRGQCLPHIKARRSCWRCPCGFLCEACPISLPVPLKCGLNLHTSGLPLPSNLCAQTSDCPANCTFLEDGDVSDSSIIPHST